MFKIFAKPFKLDYHGIQINFRGKKIAMNMGNNPI